MPILILVVLTSFPQSHAAQQLALVNTCQAEEHVGAASISCTLSTTAGNWIIATGTGAGTNAACTQNPILGINAFSFDVGALFTNWHGSNKLSVEGYDSGMLTSSGSLVVTLSGQCTLNFASLTVYQFTGATGVSAPASPNVCNAQPAGVTSLTCSLTGLAGYGWVVGHGSADCASCSYSNQVNTITQASGGNFTDYVGIVKTVTPNVANAFTITNVASFNGGVSALEITGNPPPPTASTNLDNAVVAGSSILIVLVMIAEIALVLVSVSLIPTFLTGELRMSNILTLGVGILIMVILAVTFLAVAGTFDPIFRAQGN